MKPEDRVDLAEARGWVDAVFVVVSLAASEGQGPTCPGGDCEIGLAAAGTWGLLPCILPLGAAVPPALGPDPRPVGTQATVTARCSLARATPLAPLLQAQHLLARPWTSQPAAVRTPGPHNSGALGTGCSVRGGGPGPWEHHPACWSQSSSTLLPRAGGWALETVLGLHSRDRVSYTLVLTQDPGAGPVPASAQREGPALLPPLGPGLLWAGHTAPHRRPPHAWSWWPHWAGQGWLGRGSPCGPGLQRLLGAAAPPPPGLTPHTWCLPGTVASGHTLAPAPAIPGPSPPQCPKTPWLHPRLLGAPPSSPLFTPDGRPPDPIRDGHRHLTGQHWMVPGL
uniref:Basic proline-rich protein-like n=1 Tax=Tursiops truncatus TaxID=9739 RepID=A0A6J3Q5T1_TURTR|nr:basic proline-rich protein-like [Tursiops truncatus]